MKIIASSARSSAANLIVMFANLFRDISIAYTYGVTLFADVFFLALMIPILLQTVAVGAYRTSILPVIGQVENEDDRALPSFLGHRHVQNSLITVTVLIAIAITVPVYAIMLTGELPETAEGYLVHMTWAVLPMYFFSTSSMLMEGALHSRRYFFTATALRMLMPLGIGVASLFVATESKGMIGIYILCVGGLVGAVLHHVLIVQLSRAKGLLGKPAGRLDKYDAQLFRQFKFLTFGMVIVYVAPIIDQWMATWLGEGSVSSLSYANKLATGVASLTTGSLSPVLLAYFSSMVASSRNDVIRMLYEKMCSVLLWIGLLITVAVYLLSEPLIGVMYMRGEFGEQDVLLVTDVLQLYSLQYIPLLVSTIGFTLISSHQLNHVFIYFSVINVTVNIIGNYVFMNIWGLPGIALSTAMTYVVSLLLINAYLYRKQIIEIRVPTAIDTFCVIAILCGVLLYDSYYDMSLSIRPGLIEMVASATSIAMLTIIALVRFFGIKRNLFES